MIGGVGGGGGDEVVNLSLIIYKILSLTERTVKGKAIPLQAWTDPEGSGSLRLPDFKTIGT